MKNPRLSRGFFVMDHACHVLRGGFARQARQGHEIIGMRREKFSNNAGSLVLGDKAVESSLRQQLKNYDKGLHP